MLRWTPLALLLVFSLPAELPAANCNGTQTGLVPLTSLGAGTYQGYQGGLYPGGRIVLISIGMSNTTQEFSAFVTASNADGYRDPKVRMIGPIRGFLMNEEVGGSVPSATVAGSRR